RAAAAHRGGGQARGARAAGPEPAVRLRQHAGRQPRHAGRSAQEARARGRGRAPRVGPLSRGDCHAASPGIARARAAARATPRRGAAGARRRHRRLHRGRDGAAPHPGDDGVKARRAGGQRVNYTTAQLFDAAVKDELKFAAGERFLYSDGGYFVLGMIIEAVSGQRYRDFLDEKFFKPLGMRSTSVIDQWRILKNRAAGYTLRDGQLMNIRRVWQMELASHYGVMSTVKDLVAWDAALAAGRVLAPATLAEMWTPVRLNYGGTYPYGFGWFVDDRRGHRWISHAGITGTELSRFPNDGV